MTFTLHVYTLLAPQKLFISKTDHISEIQIGDHVNQPGNMSIRGNHWQSNYHIFKKGPWGLNCIWLLHLWSL